MYKHTILTYPKYNTYSSPSMQYTLLGHTFLIVWLINFPLVRFKKQEKK